jgi:LDH2 family malate/lactate/ureidoglycolate dehydrogenase
MIDVITGCLAGARISPEIPNDIAAARPQRLGHGFFALYVDALADREAYSTSLARLSEAVHSAPRAEGTPAFMTPGEREAGTAAARTDSIPLDAGSLNRLIELGMEFGVPFAPDAPRGGG